MLDANNAPAILPRLSEIVEAYETQRAALPGAVADFGAAVAAIERAACIGGAYGGPIWEGGRTGLAPRADESVLAGVLLKSAWQHVISGLKIREVATAKDWSQLETGMTNPPEFTLDNIRATFGKYLVDPRSHVLRGVAEAFADLDPAYKSHSKIKIGVAGLPKRIILSNALSDWSYGHWRNNQLRDVLNAMAALHETPRMTHAEFAALQKAARRGDDPEFLGVTVRGFQNGNCHLIFDPAALRAINLALAEFYGDALADDLDPDAGEKPRPSTAVSAKLQYYPSPAAVVEKLLSGLYFETATGQDGAELRILEPSCGCGRILDGVRAKVGALKWRRPTLRAVGVEYDPERAAEAQAKGHSVQVANFLQIAPQATFDYVLMNPPFAGRHYAKHIRHALQFLKPGGTLRAILPASAWYDHGELAAIGGDWEDLPVASFAECGTNVPTGIFTARAKG